MQAFRAFLAAILAVCFTVAPAVVEAPFSAALAAYTGTVTPVSKGGTGATTLDGAGIVQKTGNQTIAGNKTFSGTTSLGVTSITDLLTATATVTFNKTAGATETIATFSVSDDANSAINIKNGTGTALRFSPVIEGISNNTSDPGLFFVGAPITDSGTTAAYVIDGRRYNSGSGAALSTRPLFQVRNFGTGVATVSAAGGLAIQGGTTPSLTLGASGTAITQMRVYAPSLTPAAVTANTSAEQTFTVSGLTTADKVIVNSVAALGDGLGIVGVRVSAADTLAIRFMNTTAGDLTPAAGTYPVVAIRN